MEELKPCPICNGKAKVKLEEICYYGLFWTVICMDCGFKLGRGSTDKDTAIKEWNR